MRKHGWIYLAALWWLLFAGTALAEAPAAPQDAPAASLVFLFNTDQQDSAMVACTQQLLQPLWANTLQSGGQAVVMQAEYQGDKPVTTPLTAMSAADIPALLDQIPSMKNSRVNASEETVARSVQYQLAAAQGALADLPQDGPIDLWIINRLAEPVANWSDGKFTGKARTPLTAAADIAVELLEAYPQLRIRLLFCSDKQQGTGSTRFSEGVQAMLAERAMDGARFTVSMLDSAYVRQAVPEALGYAWQLPQVAAQAAEDGFTACLAPAADAELLLLVEYAGGTAIDIRLAEAGEALPCAWYGADGYAWVTPGAAATGQALTLTVAASFADVMQPGVTVTPFVRARQAAYTATLAPESGAEEALYRGEVRLVATADVAEAPQAALAVSGTLTLPDGRQQALAFAPIESEGGLLRWACDVTLGQDGDYQASFAASAGLSVAAECRFTVVNRAPVANEIQPVHAAINVPGVGTPALVIELASLFTDADGDTMRFTLTGGENAAALSPENAGMLVFTPGADAAEGQETVVHITAEDGHGGVAEADVALVCDDFLTHMEPLAFVPTGGTAENMTIDAGQALTLTYALARDNSALAWYQAMEAAYAPGTMPALADALEIVMTDNATGQQYATADMAQEGLRVTLAADADGLPEVTVHVPAALHAGTQKLLFAVSFQGAALESRTPALANANITVNNTAPQLAEGLAPQQSATLLLNDLPLVGAPLPMGQAVHEEMIPAAMFLDGETPDALTYAVAVEGTVTLNGQPLTDGQRALTAAEAAQPLEIQLGNLGRAKVTITASDGDLQTSRTWSLTLISLLMVAAIALAVLALALVLAAVIHHLRRPTFAGKAICLEQHGESRVIPMGKALWLDGMTLAQAAIMAGLLPCAQLTAEVLADIRIEPGRRKTYRLALGGKAAQVALRDGDGRALPPKEPLRENVRYDVTLGGDSLRMTIGDPSALEW